MRFYSDDSDKTVTAATRASKSSASGSGSSRTRASASGSASSGAKGKASAGKGSRKASSGTTSGRASASGKTSSGSSAKASGRSAAGSSKAGGKKTGSAAGSRSASAKTGTGTGKRGTRAVALQDTDIRDPLYGQNSAGGASDGFEKGNGRSSSGSDSRTAYYIRISLIVIATILLMLSNFHLCGSLGNVLYSIMHGMFGTMGYLLPPAILAAYLYLNYHPDEDQAYYRVEALTGIFVLLCSFFQVCSTPNNKSLNPADYYVSQDHIGGGVIGGMISGLLQKILGTPAAVIIILVLILLMVVLITQTSPIVLLGSLFTSIREGFKNQLDGFTEEQFDAIQDRRNEDGDKIRIEPDDAQAEEARRRAEEEWRLEQERRAREQARADRFRSSRNSVQDPGRISDLGDDWNTRDYDQDPADYDTGNGSHGPARSGYYEDDLVNDTAGAGQAGPGAGRQGAGQTGAEPGKSDAGKPGLKMDQLDYDDAGSRKKNGFIPAFLANGFPFGGSGSRRNRDRVSDDQYDMTDLRLRDFPDSSRNSAGANGLNGTGHVRDRIRIDDQLAGGNEYSPDPEVTSTDEYDLRSRYKDGRGSGGSYAGSGRSSRVQAPRDRRPIDQIGLDSLLADDVPVYTASGIDDFIVYDGLSRQYDGNTRPAYVNHQDKQYDRGRTYRDDLYDDRDFGYEAEPYDQTDPYYEADPYDQASATGQSSAYGQAGPTGQTSAYGQAGPAGQADTYHKQDPYKRQDSGSEPDPYYDLDDDEDPSDTYDPYENVDYRRDLRSDGVTADGIIPEDYGRGTSDSSKRADASRQSGRTGAGAGQSIWRDPSDTASRGSSGAVTFRGSGNNSSGAPAGTGAPSGTGAADGTGAGNGGGQNPARTQRANPRPAQKKKKTKYKFPSTELLNRNNASYGGDIMTQREMQEELRMTLENFGVSVTMGDIAAGPTVTRFELIPDPGVKVSRITGLQDDIKLALASADVRIEAPIPGKRAVGIEVPNSSSSIVGFRELVESREFRRSPSNLSVCVGRNLDGEIEIADLAKMPHLLIAGATGSGKSVCINTFIMSILYKADPEDVKMIMIDPKVVELSVYNGIPHLLIPVVTDARKAANALHWAVEEMDARYRKFAKWNARNITGYNDTLARKKKEDPSLDEEPMAQMVIIIDELADLMMVSPSEVEESICRLAQKARAAGIHMVLATQRPSVNVITGLIKANVPSRIAFAVSSGIDSRTIIDMNGAEKLLGKGDMLYYPYGFQKPIRVQGAFISDEEVSRVVDKIIEENGEPSGEEMMEQLITSASESSGSRSADRDEYFEEAGRFIIENDKATSGSLQRQFHIGFNRAARIMDQLAEAGVVGEEQGTKPRQIMMNMEQFEAMLNS